MRCERGTWRWKIIAPKTSSYVPMSYHIMCVCFNQLYKWHQHWNSIILETLNWWYSSFIHACKTTFKRVESLTASTSSASNIRASSEKIEFTAAYAWWCWWCRKVPTTLWESKSVEQSARWRKWERKFSAFTNSSTFNWLSCKRAFVVARGPVRVVSDLHRESMKSFIIEWVQINRRKRWFNHCNGKFIVIPASEN